MKVIFSGENPGLTLMKPGTDEPVATASYWRCVYSEHGEGNALLIWVDPDGSGLGQLSPHAIYTDNTGVARLVTDRFTQHFGGFKERGFTSIEPTPARFFQDSDSRWYHRVTCNPGDQVIELTWWDVLAYNVVERNDYELGDTKWHLTTLICPCGSAAISVRNQSVQGEVRVNQGESTSSSAFLAFSETWSEPS
jgi:hypothetical protein